MSYVFDSSAILQAIKRNAIEYLAEGHTVEIARYELSNILWKEHNFHKRITSRELEQLVDLVKKVLSNMSILGVECHEMDILSVARTLKMTFYDASYVYHARKRRVALMTEDLTLWERQSL